MWRRGWSFWCSAVGLGQREARHARSPSRTAFVRLILASTILALVHAMSAQAQSTDDSLQLYAARVGDAYGLYLANGLVITASHKLARGDRPMVGIGGRDFLGKVIKTGSNEDVDLALVIIETQQLPLSVRMRRIEFCENPVIGEPVVVVFPEGNRRSTIVSPSVLPAELRAKFSTLIQGDGNLIDSGSGVFRVGKKCLLGMVSRSLQGSSANESDHVLRVVKYFVPAATISAFIPNWFRARATSQFGK